jgi:hypothetical protein
MKMYESYGPLHAINPLKEEASCERCPKLGPENRPRENIAWVSPGITEFHKNGTPHARDEGKENVN